MYRKGVDNERPDALSRRDQDRLVEGDPRLLSRERQVLTPINASKLCINGTNIAEGHEVFVNEDLQELWDQAIEKDKRYIQVVNAVQSGERAWPKNLKLQI